MPCSNTWPLSPSQEAASQPPTRVAVLPAWPRRLLRKKRPRSNKKKGKTAGQKIKAAKDEKSAAESRLADVLKELTAYKNAGPADTGAAKGKGKSKGKSKGKDAAGTGVLPASLRPGKAVWNGKRACFDYARDACQGPPGKQCSKGFWHICTICGGDHSRLHCRRRSE